MKSTLRELQDSMVQLKINGQEDSQEYANLLQQASEIQDRYADVQRQIKENASDTLNIDIAPQSLQGLISAVGVYKTTLSVLGIENDNLEQVLIKMQGVITLLTSVTQIQNLTQKESLIYSKAKKLTVTYVTFTDIINKTSSNFTTKEYKNYKGLKKRI